VNHQSNTPKVPYSIIQAATGGDTAAIYKIVNHYKGYISKLSIRCCRDQYGNIQECIDEDMHRQIETKLVMEITNFKIYRKV